MKAAFKPLGYTGRSRSGVQGSLIQLAKDSVTLDTHRGENWPSKGYQVSREVGDSHSKPCSSWVHTHTDEGQTTLYFYDTALYEEDGTDNPTALVTGLTQSWKSVFASQGDPSGMSVWINGTDADSTLIQEISGALDVRDINFDEPNTSVVTTPGGGGMTAGTYHVAVTYEDKDGAVAVETKPFFEKNVVVSGSDSIDVSIEASVVPARATHWNVYISTPASSGGTATDNLNFYTLQSDSLVIGTTSVSIVSIDATITDIPAHINQFPRQATFPLSNVDSAIFHKGRLFIASSTSNKVYFSERDNPNHWYTINEVTAGSESSFSGGIMGMVSAYDSVYVFTQSAIHRVWGDFTRDDIGDSPSYILNMGQGVVDTTRGLVGPNAVTVINGTPWFMSDQGLAVIGANGSKLVAPADAQGMLDCLDHTYRDRWVVAEDPNGYVCVLVTRLTNSSRPQDGASVAGVADRILRWDYRNSLWACPLAMGDITHLNYRTDAAAGAVGGEQKLMAANFTGRILEMGIGYSGGVLDTSGTEYNGQASTTEGPLTVVYTEAGIAADKYNGYTVTLKYPDDDTSYPGMTVQKTIVDTGVSGSTVTLTWVGALTAPTGSAVGDTWTVRVTGLLRPHDIPYDAAILPGIEPGHRPRVKGYLFVLKHVIGVEATS